MFSETSFEWPLDNFDYDEFKINIDNNVPVYDYDDNIGKCLAEIYIDYQTNFAIISFGDSFQWSRDLHPGEGRLDFLIMFDQYNTEAEFYHVLEYVCYDKNECDKLFVFNHIQWLRQVNYTLFATYSRSILFNNLNKTEYCFIDKLKLSKCSSRVCVGKYSSTYKNYFFECHQNAEAFVEVHLTINMIVIEETFSNNIHIEEHKIIRYTCKFNQCNNQTLTDTLINIVDKYFDLSSMKDAFLFSYIKNENDTTTISFLNSSDQTTFQTQINGFSSLKSTTNERVLCNIAKNNFHLSLNFIFILLFLLFSFY